ncbi:MAG: hypothetical protein JWM10_1286, partial [Myxococcaceae bacterium]|nr:hypothetical protein [Myxococcaceae bacterium]
VAAATDPAADAFLLVAGALLVAAALLPAAPLAPRSRALGPLAAAALALVALAAWPLLDAPFDTDAPVLRAAFAAVDVFGDWNHPFLPYLLNRPATWVSLEPRALRVVPFVFLCAEAALAVRAAARDGGPLAGALCGAWFACEVPRRHGLADLGDWDVAGAFLLALVAWAQRPSPPRAGAWVALALLLAAGVLSSWLMIVPAGVLALCLLAAARRAELPRGPVAAVAAVVAALSVAAGRVFLAGHGGPEPGHAQEVARAMLVESPVGRSAAMAAPAALGLAWAFAGRAQLARRFALGALVAVPAAVAVAFRWSHVNGGYYAGLVTPLLCYVAAAATARALAAAGPSPEARVLLALAVGALTVDLVPASPAAGWNQLRAFARGSSRDARPIVTNSASLARVIGFERARAGDGPIAAAITPPAALARRVRLVGRGDCALRGGEAELAGGFHLVLLRQDDPAGRRACVERYGPRCAEAAGGSGPGERAAWVYRCRAAR